MEIPVAFGLVLKRSRQAAGLSQEALGFEAGLSKNYISLLETGQRQPTLTSLLSLGACQGSCRPIHARRGALFSADAGVSMGSESRSGLSLTTAM